MKTFWLWLALMLVAGSTGGQQPALPSIDLSAGVHLIKAEVANTFSTRMEGLMRRPSMPTNQGMLFVFDQNDIHCMWMKNTLIPLSVAFLDEQGAIINIEDMQPQSEQTHCARKSARFALEMNRGWFAQRGVRAGTKLRGLEKLGKPRQ